MPAFINNDTVNNITYMNYFNAATNGEINLENSNSTKNLNLLSAFRTRHSTNFAATDNDFIYAFFNSTKENKTNKTASPANWRLRFLSPGTSFAYNSPVIINSSNLSGTDRVDVNSSIVYAGIVNYYEYAIITNNNFTASAFGSNGNSLNTASRSFLSCGWLEDSVFSGGNVTRGLYGLIVTNSGSLAFRPSVENQTTAQAILTSGSAQYSITCASNTGDGTTPGADLWCTDLWLRDNPSGYAVGRIPHVLLAKGAGFTLGNLYYNPTVIDGITDQKIWLCCANYGSDKLLQRVWTEGIS